MKKSLISLAVLLIVAYFGYNYVMAAPKNIKTSSADYNIETADFSNEFTKNQIDSEKKYTDKVIAISGKITEVEDNGVTIDGKIFCQLAETKSLKKGQSIKVKGLFIGYDDLFELIKLDQGNVVK